MLTIADYFGAGILLVIWGAQLFLRPLTLKAIRIVSWLSVIVIVSVLLYWSVAQYELWQESDSVARYLLPPYQSPNYFLTYIFFRFWASYLLSFLAGLFLAIFVACLNQKYQNRFFYDEEKYLLAVTVFLVGHPLWLVYVFGTLILWLIVSAVWLLFLKENRRISFRYFWLPAAISVILLKELLLSMEFLRVLQI